MTESAHAQNAPASKTVFNWSDPLDLDNQLREEERMVRDNAHRFAQEKLMPRILEGFRSEKFEREIMSELGEMGFLAVTLPERYGGSEMR